MCFVITSFKQFLRKSRQTAQTLPCISEIRIEIIFVQVQTNVVQVEETKFLFNIEEIGNANHIVVFMTGQTPFPDGWFAAKVYIKL